MAMKLRTVVQLGVTLSVVLFCAAVAFYGFTKLKLTDKSREIDLFSLVPADCIGVLESDNINYYLGEFPELNYAEELGRFHFPGLFNDLLGGLNEYTTLTAHGLSSKMSRVVVSFHAPGTARDQVVYFRMGADDKETLRDMLRKKMPENFRPKSERYRGKQICIYPLRNQDFLAVYSEDGFYVVSYQKSLIEKVIDAQTDAAQSLAHHPVFAQALQKKKSHNFLTLYGRTPSMPFLQEHNGCWSEFDFHMNSDVVYLTGETFMPDSCDCLTRMEEKLASVPNVVEDSLVLSADPAVMDGYMDAALEEMDHTLFNECVANMSREAKFMMVADMQKVANESEEFRAYLPKFLLENAPLFQNFILSTQLSVVEDKLLHMMVLTYKL